MKASAKKRAGRDDVSAQEASVVLLKEIRAILAETRQSRATSEGAGVAPPFSRKGELGDRFGRGEARLLCISDA